ncbi:ATP-binding protein [Streptomyces sp. NPDC086077]|uniref:ATP-binding protein n=1 Tax=Streptomyces sp. NPDC086077 TaxID=3154862 RepID=UPI00342E32B4
MASVIPSVPLGTDATAGLFGLGADGGPSARAGARVGEPADPFGSAAERRFRFELTAHPGSPAQARRLTRIRLNGWAVCEDTCDTAALVVSELVTNAILHTASDVVVCELQDQDDLVRIAVRDQGCATGEPHPSSVRAEEEHGRGLLLVDALAHAWGAHEHGPGLLVWAELPRQADSARGDLGWGARPKPDPSGGSGEDDDEAHARVCRPAHGETGTEWV